MTQEFIEEQKKIARESLKPSVEKPRSKSEEEAYQIKKYVIEELWHAQLPHLDKLISQTILATEGEMVKRVVDIAVELTNSHYGGASYQEGYRNACEGIISTLTNRV
jgi:hypothetical protein